MIPVEKIVEAIQEQAKQGSCKMCKWCFPLTDAEIEDWLNATGEGHPPTHFCYIQYCAGINAIHFDTESLQYRPYPWKCDVGGWETDARGCDDEIYGCLAYQPSNNEIQLGRANIVRDAAMRHRGFMKGLATAMYIHNAIQNNTLAKLTAQLNEAIESLSAVPA